MANSKVEARLNKFNLNYSGIDEAKEQKIVNNTKGARKNVSKAQRKIVNKSGKKGIK